jgi:hypothetical protein
VDAVPSLSPGVLTTADLLPVSGAVAAVIALVLAAVGVGQTSSTGLPLPRSGRARRGAMDDGDRGWIARRGCVIVVLLPVCIGGLGLMLGGGMAGGIAGSLSALAGLSSLVAGLLLALGPVALTPAMRVPRQRTLWLFRLAAGALLLAAVLLSLVSFPDSLLLALFPALLAFALATPWWGRR